MVTQWWIVRNQDIKEKLEVGPLSAKMRENKLRWFGHVHRKTYDAPVRRIKSIIVEGKRSQERPRRTWEEQTKGDLHELHLSKDLTRDRVSWRRFIHVLGYCLCLTYLPLLLFLAFYISLFYWVLPYYLLFLLLVLFLFFLGILFLFVNYC